MWWLWKVKIQGCAELCVGRFVLIFGGNCAYIRFILLENIRFCSVCQILSKLGHIDIHVLGMGINLKYLIENVGVFH